MAETMHEDFSTALLCLYFGLACEGRLDAEQPRVYFGPSLEESRPWSELFSLSKETQVWMSDLTKPVHGCGRPMAEESWRRYQGLKPDVWMQDDGHAIMIVNSTRRGRALQEGEFLDFLHEGSFEGLTRAFLYTVPQAWLPNREKAEWWQFVGEREAGDSVLRGIIAWDDEFAYFLSKKLGLPKYFHDKLPNKIDEGRFLDPGEHFTGGR